MTIETQEPTKRLFVSHYFLQILVNLRKLQVFLTKVPVDLSTGLRLKTGFGRAVRIDQVVVHGGYGVWIRDEGWGISLWTRVCTSPFPSIAWTSNL